MSQEAIDKASVMAAIAADMDAEQDEVVEDLCCDAAVVVEPRATETEPGPDQYYPFRWVQDEISRLRLLKRSDKNISDITGESVATVREVIRHQRRVVGDRDNALFSFYGERAAGEPQYRRRCATCGCLQEVFIPGHPCRACDRIERMSHIPA